MTLPENVRPTRGELLAVRRRIILSERAHAVLKRKLDGLMFELISRLPDARAAEKMLFEEVIQAREELAVATMMVGELGVLIAAESIEETPILVMTEKNVFGVLLPSFRLERAEKYLNERGYSLLGTTPVIDDVVSAHEHLVQGTVHAAQAEAALRLLTAEIARTRRRVRALENRVLPGLREIRRMIELRREEMDIEEHARLFQVKRIRAIRGAESIRRPADVPVEDLPSSARRGP
ncbi:V-type sodium ATPase subunit D [anaerobic digester metagenome]